MTGKAFGSTMDAELISSSQAAATGTLLAAMGTLVEGHIPGT